MGSVFEYRRLAGVSLDLAKRAVALADKMRLLRIAKAWLDLADRVARNASDGARRADSRQCTESDRPLRTGKTAHPGGYADRFDFREGRI
jgi:hypothetical protein